MPIHNTDIAAKFEKMADWLEIRDKNRFRVRSYRDAARTIESLSTDLTDLVDREADLTELSDIGDAIASKIETIVETGELPQLEEARGDLPESVRDMLGIEGVGPKTVARLYDELGLEDLDQLEKAAKNGEVQQLKGFGPKTEQNILDNIDAARKKHERIRLADAKKRAEPFVEYLEQVEGVDRVEIAGSYRRQKETVGDIDILVSCDDHDPVMEAFVSYDDVVDVVSQGSTRSTVYIRPRLQIDLRVVDSNEFGAALHYFTGSKAHNIECRQRSIERDRKLNEYGVFEGDQRIAGETEIEVYEAMDLPFIEPELREAKGEIEAAQNGELPDLVEVDDIRGDLHMHTEASDGSNTIQQMAEAAIERGYDYIAITDHSQSSRVANGLDADRLRDQMERIDEVNRLIDDIEILKGSEVDIRKDGALDFPDDLLADLDFRVCSIHSNFGLDRESQTERVLTAMENPYFDVLGHPTGRLLGARQPYPIDIEHILERAAELGKCVELNAQPSRLDLNDDYCRKAKQLGVPIVISTDAHRTGHFDVIEFGVNQARRGWLEPDDVLNTRPLPEVLEKLAG